MPDDHALLNMLVDLQDHHNKEADILLEQISLLRAQLYGRKSEKERSDDGPQPLPLFDMPEPVGEQQEAAEETPIPAHTRKKAAGNRCRREHLPRIDRIHDIDPAEKICACGCELSRIGEEVTRRPILFALCT